MRKIALIYVTYDGLINCMCGVGIISQMFIEAFEDVRAIYFKKSIQLDLYLIAVDLNQDAMGYSNDLKRSANKIAAKNGGSLKFISNNTNKKEQFGTLENWNTASKNSVQEIVKICDKYRESLVYLIDTPFMKTPYYLNKHYRDKSRNKIKKLLVLHSDVFSHLEDKLDLKRLEWEATAIKISEIDKDTYIANTSKHLTELLKKHYKINKLKLINLQTGIYFKSKRYLPLTDIEIENKLKEHNIPLDKDIVFSVGRAVSYKGFENLIKSIYTLKNPNIHLVFIASPYKNALSNIDSIKDALSHYKINSTAILTLNMELPRYIYQWKNTKIVAQLSTREPFGLVPEEVRLNKKAIILAGQIGGYIEQINDGEDGFLVNPTDAVAIANKMKKILNLTAKDKERILNNGYKRCYDNYNYIKSITKSIEELI